MDASDVDAGFLIVRARTWNVLYVIRGLGEEPVLGEPQRVEIDSLWAWTGALWGGAVPDDDIGSAE